MKTAQDKKPIDRDEVNDSSTLYQDQTGALLTIEQWREKYGGTEPSEIRKHLEQIPSGLARKETHDFEMIRDSREIPRTLIPKNRTPMVECIYCRKLIEKDRIDQHNNDVHPYRNQGKNTSSTMVQCRYCMKMVKREAIHEHNDKYHPAITQARSDPSSMVKCWYCKKMIMRKDLQQHNIENHQQEIEKTSSSHPSPFKNHNDPGIDPIDHHRGRKGMSRTSSGKHLKARGRKG